MAQVDEAAGGRVKITRGVSRDNPDPESLPEDGRVENVCKRWLVHEDGAIAHQLQEQEYNEHFGWNRKTRRTVRTDIQVSKYVQNEEEVRAQEEQLQRLKEMKRLAEKDEKIAKQLEEENKRLVQEEALKQRQKERDDEELASQYQEYLMKREQELLKSRLTQDELIARQVAARLKTEETSEDQLLSDEQLARKLQRREEAKYEQRKREWELKKERRKIEKAIAQHSTDLGVHMPSHRRGSDEADAGSVSPTIEDTGDFSDFYVKPAEPLDKDEELRLQQDQDMEIARLLQEQEHKRRGGVTPPAVQERDKLKQIEEQDAELARIIQEEERLKAKKHRHKHKRRENEPMSRSQSLPAEASLDSRQAPAVSRTSSSDEATRVPPTGQHFSTETSHLMSLRQSSESVERAKFQVDPQEGSEMSSVPFNIAEVIDPTFRRSRASNSPPVDPAPPIPMLSDAPHTQGARPYTQDARPYTQAEEAWNPQDEGYDEQGIAPVQGMRRSPGDKKGRKNSASGKRASCKQQ